MASEWRRPSAGCSAGGTPAIAARIGKATYKVEWDRELERRQRLGITAPDPLPHPDHVQIDYRTGRVAIRGPMTKVEKAEWDYILATRADITDAVAHLREGLKTETDLEEREDLERHIRIAEETLEHIRRAIPDDME